MNYIDILQEEIKSIPRQKRHTKYNSVQDWWNNQKRESLLEQIELYKINKWRLCEPSK